MRRILPLVLATVAATLIGGCNLVYPCANPIELEGYEGVNCFVDPPIVVDESQVYDPSDHDPYLELGFYEEQLYEALADGDDCPIAPQSQGGVWAMPAVRTQGIGSPSAIECTLVAETGEVVNESKLKVKMYLSTDGFLEFQQLPLRIREANKYEDVEDLFGVGADLECTVTDKENRSATAGAHVVFTRG